MLPALSAVDSGVALPLPGSSTGLVADPLYSGAPSVSRAMVVAISSTWPISSAVYPWRSPCSCYSASNGAGGREPHNGRTRIRASVNAHGVAGRFEAAPIPFPCGWPRRAASPARATRRADDRAIMPVT